MFAGLRGAEPPQVGGYRARTQLLGTSEHDNCLLMIYKVYTEGKRRSGPDEDKSNERGLSCRKLDPNG